MTPLALQPAPASSVSFSYSAKLSNGVVLPKDLIDFNPDRLEFTVKSSDQTLVAEYAIKVDATSYDERWTG